MVRFYITRNGQKRDSNYIFRRFSISKIISQLTKFQALAYCREQNLQSLAFKAAYKFRFNMPKTANKTWKHLQLSGFRTSEYRMLAAYTRWTRKFVFLKGTTTEISNFQLIWSFLCIPVSLVFIFWCFYDLVCRHFSVSKQKQTVNSPPPNTPIVYGLSFKIAQCQPEAILRTSYQHHISSIICRPFIFGKTHKSHG